MRENGILVYTWAGVIYDWFFGSLGFILLNGTEGLEQELIVFFQKVNDSVF